MKRFYKILLSVLIIFAVVLLLLPLGIGFWLKSNYQQLLTRLISPDQATVTITQFDRGWFASHATIQITLKGPWLNGSNPSPIKPIILTVKKRIVNGPFLTTRVAGRKHIMFGKGFIYSASNNPDFTFQSSTLIHFNNTIDNQFQARNITLAGNQKQLVLNGIDAHTIYRTSDQHLKSNITIKSIALAQQQSMTVIPTPFQKRVVMTNLAMNANVQQESTLWYGQRSLTADNITYYDSKNEATVIDHLRLQSKQSKFGDTTAISIMGHSNAFTSKRVALKPINFKLNFTHLNTKALATMTKAINKMQTTTTIDRDAFNNHLLQPLTELASHGLSAALNNLNIGTSDGNITMQAKMTVAPQQRPNIMMMIANTNGELHLQLPLSWLSKELALFYKGKKITVNNKVLTPEEMAQQKINDWLTNKKLVQDGNMVKLDLTYHQGQLLLNGQTPRYRATVSAPAARDHNNNQQTNSQQP